MAAQQEVATPNNGLPRETWLRNEIEELTKSIKLSEKAQSWQASSTLRMRRHKARNELDELMAKMAAAAEEAQAVPDDAGPEEVIAGMVSALLEMPPDMLRRILDQVGGSGLRVVQGG
jgi:hypothetical protein